MTKALGYIRVSTQGKVRDGYSLAYQWDEIMRYCTDNGIERMHIYEDKGISGAVRKLMTMAYGLIVEREGLQSMLTDLASVSVDCVVVLNTSQLGNGRQETFRYDGDLHLQSIAIENGSTVLDAYQYSYDKELKSTTW
jgi:DNA invertase Pin-like site-specific DNA recombinase